MAFLTNINIQNTRHETMAFAGKWRDSFGTPAPHGTWIIYGVSGSGKTSFALQLAKYLTEFGTVIYWTIEQGNSLTFQKAWKREKMSDCGGKIIVADDEVGVETMRQKMAEKRSRDILIVDSLTPLRSQSFNILQYEKFKKATKNKLVIWLSHEKFKQPDTSVGDYILKLSDLKMRVEGYKVFTNTRAGEKLKEFIVWQKGADEYYANNQ